MRVAASCASALLVIIALSVAASSDPTSSACATKADQAALAAHSKASSFAPHAASHSRIYGAPIQSRILKSRPRKKPQLTSSPLPDASSANTSSGG